MEWIPLASMIIAILLILPAAIWWESRKRNKKRSLIVPDQRKWFGLFLVLFLVVGCDNHKAEPDTIAGAESEKISFPQFPNFPTSPFPATTKPTTEGSTEETTTPTSNISKESGTYWGTPNGGRPQWYFKKKMSQYPKTFKLVIDGCVSRTITNNGNRFEGSNGLVVKQSEVSGRGMAVVGPYGCVSKTAYVE